MGIFKPVTPILKTGWICFISMVAIFAQDSVAGGAEGYLQVFAMARNATINQVLIII